MNNLEQDTRYYEGKHSGRYEWESSAIRYVQITQTGEPMDIHDLRMFYTIVDKCSLAVIGGPTSLEDFAAEDAKYPVKEYYFVVRDPYSLFFASQAFGMLIGTELHVEISDIPSAKHLKHLKRMQELGADEGLIKEFNEYDQYNITKDRGENISYNEGGVDHDG